MSSESKNEKKDAPRESADKRPDPIAIKSLHFRGPHAVTLPNGTTVTAIDGSPRNDRVAYEIHLLPWLRMFRVTSKPTGTEKPRTFLVPESWAVAEVTEN